MVRWPRLIDNTTDSFHLATIDCHFFSRCVPDPDHIMCFFCSMRNKYPERGVFILKFQHLSATATNIFYGPLRNYLGQVVQRKRLGKFPISPYYPSLPPEPETETQTMTVYKIRKIELSNSRSDFLVNLTTRRIAQSECSVSLIATVAGVTN